MDEKKKENKVTEGKKQEVKVEKVAKSEPAKPTKTEEKPKVEKKVETKKAETKKFENKNSKKDNKNKRTTWLTTGIVGIVVIALVVLLTIMIVTSSDPKKSVDGLLTNLREGDFEKAQEFLNGGELVSEDEFNAETKALLFDKLAWKVGKITEENDQATIEIEITNKDFKTLISNYMQKALKAAFGGANITQEEMENYFVEELKNKEVQTVTETKTIQAIKEDKKWKVVANDELTNALLPGLQEAVNAFN